MAGLDIGFKWPLDFGGYEIKTRKGGSTRLTDESEEYIVRCGGKLGQTEPIKIKPTLFMDFANLDRSAESCLEFANTWGYLGLFLSPADPPPDDKISRGGESLSGWQDAITNMREVVEIWERNPRALLADGLYDLKVANLDAVLVPSPPDNRPALRIRPRSLIGAMKLQFAQEVASGADVGTCAHCGKWFEAGGAGLRRDAKYCSDVCRTDHHYSKKRKAS